MRGSGDGRSGVLEPEMATRAAALARRIREHREAFARSRATLSKIEQNHIYPSMRTRRKLAKALGVGPQELWNARPDGITDRGEESEKQAS
jgi:transcriptional regulator with XRE-family HTH domain